MRAFSILNVYSHLSIPIGGGYVYHAIDNYTARSSHEQDSGILARSENPEILSRRTTICYTSTIGQNVYHWFILLKDGGLL